MKALVRMRFVPLLLTALLVLVVIMVAPETSRAAPLPVDLGTASSFAVLAGTAVVNSGPTTITGDVGVYPLTMVSGFPPGIVNPPGTIHAGDAVAHQAQNDLTTAYNDAAGRTPVTASIPVGQLGGLTLNPGVYDPDTVPSFTITGTLTLDAQNDPDAVFIFKAGSTLTTASDSSVSLINGARSCRVYWQVGTSATLQTRSHFEGLILAMNSITAENGTTVKGQLLARNGAVTLDTASVTATNLITVTQGAHGTITPGGVVSVNNGDSQAFTIAPDAHYRIKKITVDGSDVASPVSPYTFTDVTTDHTITAEFEMITHDVTVTQAAHGAITPAGTGGVVTVNDGANQAFTIKPDADYHVAYVKVDGASVGALTSYMFTNVTANHTITATFSQDQQPSDSSTWYLAEGTSAWGFSTYISIANPNTTAVHASITYMTGSGNVSGGTITLPAKSQTTVNPADKLGNKDFSTKVVCTEGMTIAVDRTMSWTGPGAASPEGHSSVGVTSPAKTWYLPEGCSAFGFECWLLIQNPNGGTANCQVTYMIEGEAPKTVSHSVPANSRQSFNMETDIGQKNASIKVVSNIPVIPERAMYRNNKREGHDSIGTTTAASDYFLAEGTTAWGFTTWVLIQNPGSSPSDVTITYMTPSGKKVQPSFTLPGNSRKTIKVNDVAGMANTDFSTQVHGTKPIIAERSMYWDNGTGEACHDSIGMDAAHTTFYLPDGQTSEGRETWTLVQNPNSSAVSVEVSYLKAGGGAVTLTSSIPANSRKTFNMVDKVASGRASIMVTSKTAGKKIMVERAMYWNNRGAGTDTVGGYSD